MTLAAEVLADHPTHYWSCDQAGGTAAVDSGSSPVDLDAFPDDDFGADAPAACDAGFPEGGDCWDQPHNALALAGLDLPRPLLPPAAWSLPLDLFATSWTVEWWNGSPGSGWNGRPANPLGSGDVGDEAVPAEAGVVWSWGDMDWALLCYLHGLGHPYYSGTTPWLLGPGGSALLDPNLPGPEGDPTCRCACDHVVVTWDAATHQVLLYRGGLLVTTGAPGAEPRTLAPLSGPRTFRWFLAQEQASGEWWSQVGGWSNLAIYQQALPLERVRAHWLAGGGQPVDVAGVRAAPCLLGYTPPVAGTGWTVGSLPQQ